MRNVEDMIDKSNCFECIKMHAPLMPKATCIARQIANENYCNNPLYPECVKCEQGERIIMENTKLCKECKEKPTISEKALYVEGRI